MVKKGGWCSQNTLLLIQNTSFPLKWRWQYFCHGQYMFQQERQKNDGKKNKSIAQFGGATSRCILMCHHCNGNTTLSCKAGLCDTGGEDATVCFFKSRWGYEVNTNNTGEDLALFEKIRLRPLLISITLTQPPPPPYNTALVHTCWLRYHGGGAAMQYKIPSLTVEGLQGTDLGEKFL